MNHKHPIDIINGLRNTTSSKEKIAIMESHKDNPWFKEVLRLTYDPTLNYYLKTAKYGSGEPVFGLKQVFHLLENILAKRKVTGNEAKDVVRDFISYAPPKDQQIFDLILKRDIKAGVSDKSILKVFPNLFPKFPYMRCSAKGDIKYPCLSEVKADGVFSRWFVRESEVKAYSRQGTPFINIPQYVLDDFSKLPLGVYEGELLIEEGCNTLPRQTGNGLINSCFIHGKKDLTEGQTLNVILWDVLPEEDYWKGVYKGLRCDRLVNLKGSVGYKFDHIHVVHHRIVNNEQEANEHYGHVVSQGGEGTILKDLAAIWKDGTSKQQIKKKVEEIVELRCVGYNAAAEGSKNESTFGSLLCESEGELLEVSATGITDEMRKEVWDNKDYYLGKVVSIKSNGVMFPKKEGDKHSLYLPRFVEWRDSEKSTADSLEHIISVFNS